MYPFKNQHHTIPVAQFTLNLTRFHSNKLLLREETKFNILLVMMEKVNYLK